MKYQTATDEEREAAIEAATVACRRGQLVVIPTDTVYGVGADAFDADAVNAVLAAKGRGRDVPPPVLISAASTAGALIKALPEYARALIKEFWPGPLTLVGHQQPSLRWDLGETRGTVAVRMPDDEIALAILDRTGPMAVTSANLHGQSAATSADEAEEMLGDSVEVYVDGGTSPGGTASTILDITGEQPRLLRLGGLSVADLDAVLVEHDLSVLVED